MTAPIPLAETLAALGAATTRDEIVEAVLRFGRSRFPYVAAFALTGGDIRGHDARGDAPDADRARVRRIRASPTWGSFFQTVLETGGDYLGPLPPGALNALLVADMGRPAPQTLLVAPVHLRARPVLILYADGGADPIDGGAAGEFLAAAAALPAAFERVLLARKAAAPPPAGPDRPAASAADPDVEALLAGGRPGAEALERLVARGEAGARSLAAVFPGPLHLEIESVVDMPRDLFAHGPVVGALAAIGPAARPVLVELAAHRDPMHRLYAAILLGRSPAAPGLQVLLEAVFDPDRRVRVAAREALRAHREVPGYAAALDALRAELGRTRDPDRLSAAVRTLAWLRDRACVRRLVELLGRAAPAVAEEAARALQVITKQAFGADAAAWQAWLTHHGDRPRFEWLIAGLEHPRLEIRAASLQEIERLTGETFGYRPDAPPEPRAEAAARWRAWWRARARGPVLGAARP